jgi:hypothetical protein
MQPTTKPIDGKTKSVRALLHSARFAIDVYQREYAWESRQVRELVDDLTARFLEFHRPEHGREDVARYGHYFLGAIVISHRDGQRFIVDGQQRLTTLTLLLIRLRGLAATRDDVAEVRELIYSERYGKRSFNMDVPERAECMDRLFNREPCDTSDASESVRNMVARYDDIDLADVEGPALPYFVDWLLDNVHLVEIEAFSDSDAYTVFETMNDRGLRLSLPDMLKGYLLANAGDARTQQELNGTWRKRIRELLDLGPEEDVDFFKSWLRARHANTARASAKSNETRDYERIGSEFHRWVRDHHDQIGLKHRADFEQFIRRDFDFYARQAIAIRNAATKVTNGLESIRYNHERGFTMQTQVLLAALEPGDLAPVVTKKLGLVADYLDIWLARRVWSYRSVAQSSVRYAIFALTKELRGLSVESLAKHLRNSLDQETATFAKSPDFAMHTQNYRQVRHILARLTLWIDEQCGVPTHFDDLVSEGKGRPFEVEHIWPNKYSRFAGWFRTQQEFEQRRNFIGGLLLLQRGHNQSLGDRPYEDKLPSYAVQSQSLLTRSLHALAYENAPAFRKLIERTGLPFRHHDTFDIAAQEARQELYLRIAEWVWNPSRLDLDGLKDPVPEPLEEVEDESALEPLGGESERHQARLKFWNALLAQAKAAGTMHAHLSPGNSPWLGTRQDGLWWNFVVLQDRIRAELYIDRPLPIANKALFDKLLASRDRIESALGRSVLWQRLDDKRASRISVSVPGGWTAEEGWATAIPAALQAMDQLYRVLAPLASDQ